LSSTASRLVLPDPGIVDGVNGPLLGLGGFGGGHGSTTRPAWPRRVRAFRVVIFTVLIATRPLATTTVFLFVFLALVIVVVAVRLTATIVV